MECAAKSSGDLFGTGKMPVIWSFSVCPAGTLALSLSKSVPVLENIDFYVDSGSERRWNKLENSAA